MNAFRDPIPVIDVILGGIQRNIGKLGNNKRVFGRAHK